MDHIKRNFYSVRRAETWSAQYKDYAENLTDEQDFVRQTRTALDALHSSHTAYYRADDPHYYGLLSIFESLLRPQGVWYESIGIDVEGRPEGYFARVVFAGGPAAKAGILRGDRLVSVEGLPYQPITSFENKSGSKVTLRIQRRKNGTPLTIQLVPRRIKPRVEWLEAQEQGTRIFSRGKKRIGYIPFFSGTGEEYPQAAQDAIAGDLQGADALIIDFRNGFGGFNPDFVSLFDRTIPRLTFHDRNGKTTVLDRQWRKPLYVLINGGSRSGKEVIAYSLQKHHRATLVGERTAGAVLGGRPFLLSDGSLLYLAVTDGEVDGQRLEGKGVKPDVASADVLPYSAGKDVQMEQALMLAVGIRQRKVGRIVQEAILKAGN